MPKGNGLYLLQMQLTDQAGKVLHRNFVTFVVKDGDPVQDTGLPMRFVRSRIVLGPGLVGQAVERSGRTESQRHRQRLFRIHDSVACRIEKEDIAAASLVFEASAKQLFGKDLEGIDSLVDLDF